LHLLQRQGQSTLSNLVYLVVFVYAQFKDIAFARYSQLLVNLMLNRKTVAVPTKSSRDMVASGASKTGDNVFNCTSKDVAVVRQPRRERRAVIKYILRASFATFELLLECIVFLPKTKDSFFLQFDK
jgi:hypothetical protein